MKNKLKSYIFFTPTKHLRHYFLLDAIEEDGKLSQRDLSATAGISPSVTNQYLKEFEKMNLIKRTSLNDRDFRYSLTKKGKRKRRELMVSYIRETFKLFSAGKVELAQILNDYSKKLGCKKIIFYSAGEVTELLIHSLENTELELKAIVDDDKQKQGNKLFGYPIIKREDISIYNPDTVIITTFRYRDQIYEKIKRLEEDGIKVVGF